MLTYLYFYRQNIFMYSH